MMPLVKPDPLQFSHEDTDLKEMPVYIQKAWLTPATLCLILGRILCD
jgi:hypothetical protein